MSEKLRINPSMIRLSGRCDFAVALSLMVDPKTGKPFEPHYGSQTQVKMYMGIAYEHLVTGKKFVPREGDEGNYEHWLDNEATSNQLDRLNRYATHTKKRYVVPHEENKCGEWVESNLPDMTLVGEMDFVGYVKTDKGEVIKGIVDIKLTNDLLTWELGGQAMKEQFLQSPIYSLALAASSAKEPEKFAEAVRLHRQGFVQASEEMIEQWADGTEMLPALFLICENRDTAKYVKRGDRERTHREPHIRLQIIYMEATDYLYLYERFLAPKEVVWNSLIMLGSKYKPEGIFKANPSLFKCYGVAFGGAQKGRCPMLDHCPYGRSLVGNTHDVTFKDLSEML